mmetsp:Transcript_35518/g.79623  ORF Transcript_35518/g.79623 Transcript_35518/m.79623 type:complete len:210 (+) Transcript_35518:1587-2216(+)
MPAGAADGRGPDTALEGEVESVVPHDHGWVVLLATAILLAVCVALTNGEIGGNENTISHQLPCPCINGIPSALAGSHLEPIPQDLGHCLESGPVVGHCPLSLPVVHRHPGGVTAVVPAVHGEREAGPPRRGLVQDAAPAMNALRGVAEITALASVEKLVGLLDCGLATVLVHGLHESLEEKVVGQRVLIFFRLVRCIRLTLSPRLLGAC